jgi:hypothetical protein
MMNDAAMNQTCSMASTISPLSITHPQPHTKASRMRRRRVQKCVEKIYRIPHRLAEDDRGRRADDDADEADEREAEGHRDQLRPDGGPRVRGARRKVRCVPGTQDQRLRVFSEPV